MEAGRYAVIFLTGVVFGFVLSLLITASMIGV